MKNATLIRLLAVSITVLASSAAWTDTVRAAPPVLNPIANMTVGVGGCSPSSADQAISATDPDGDAITFTSSGPSFMTLTSNPQVGNTRTGNIHLSAPPPGTTGTFPASVTATANGESDTKTFTISVIVVNQPPVLNQPANMAVTEGATADQTITGSDPCGAPLTFFKVSGPAFMTVTTTNATTGNIHLAPGFTDSGTYTATVRASNGTLSSDKSFTITVNSGCDGAPIMAQPANMTVSEGGTADQTITASHPCGDLLTFAFIGPPFMTLTSNPQVGNTRTANVHLAPTFSDAGSYTATIRVSNGFVFDQKSFTIAVTQVCSGGPVANAGGPYQGFVNVPMSFDGSGSSDPNGGALTFAWDFGDGATASGVMPVHTYVALGTYAVVLTVTGDCGTSSSSTTAEILQACDAFAFTQGGNRTIRLNSGRPRACVQIQPQTGCFQVVDVILSSIVMKYTGGAVTEIHAIADKTAIDSDTNGDGITEITVCFRKDDLRRLFSGLPGGQSTPTVTLEGDLASGGRFHATLVLSVISNGGGLAAAVSPNPFNPAGTLTFVTARPGFAKVDLFDLAGRLVRTLLDERSLGAGEHEVRIEGRGSRGESLASGIYFIRGVSAEGKFTKTIAVLK